MKQKITLLGLILILAVVGLSPAQAQTTNEQCAAPSWTGYLYANPDLSGTPHAIFCRRIIHFDWGGGSPWKGVDVDNFSFRWSTQYQFPTAGKYMFAVSVAGGVRFYFNNQLLIDHMEDGGVRTYTLEYDIATPGVAVPIMIESAHRGGTAQLKFAWYLIQGGSSGATADHNPSLSAGEEAFTNDGGNVWFIENYANLSFSGDPVSSQLHVADGAEFDYQERAPSAGMPEDGWSARWTRTVDFPTGSYTFTLRADDAARVLVDGQEVIPQTNLGATGTGSIQLSAGRHKIVLEHADASGPASIFLTWSPPVGTMLLPNGCNARFTAGVNGNAPLCAGSPPATFDSGTFSGTAGPVKVIDGASIGDVAGRGGGSATASTGGANTPGTTTGGTTNLGTVSNRGTTLTATVNAGPLYFRPQPSKDAEAITQIHRGEQYTALGRSADNVWVQLEVGELVGWSMAEYLTLQGDINSLPVTDGSASGGGISVNTPTTTSGFGEGTIFANSGVSVGNTPSTNTVTVFNADGTTSSIVVPAVQSNVRAQATGHMRLRAGPGENFDRVGGVAYGAEVTVIGRNQDGSWIQVVTAEGVQGWSAAEWYTITQGSLSEVPVTG